MTADEMLDQIEQIFPDAECELKHDSPFQLIVAVILSAQTTDASVNKITPALFKRYPDCNALALADPVEVEPYIRTIGLFRSKSKHIVEMARDLKERFNGEVPDNFKDLCSLAGVGRKTANVVMSVAFDKPALAVDTHVNRVSKRLGLAKEDDSVEKVEAKLKRKISRSRWNQAHHDLIFFGRYLCKSQRPECDRCPFEPCKWKKKQDKIKPSGGKKKMSEKKIDASNVADLAEALVSADETLIQEKKEWKDKANEVLDTAKAMADAENAVVNAAEGIEPFTPPKDEELLFDEIEAEVQTQNDLVNVSPSEKKRERDERLAHEPRGQTLESVVDEKIKEEQKKNAEQALRNEIVEGLE